MSQNTEFEGNQPQNLIETTLLLNEITNDLTEEVVKTSDLSRALGAAIADLVKDPIILEQLADNLIKLSTQIQKQTMKIQDTKVLTLTLESLVGTITRPKSSFLENGKSDPFPDPMRDDDRELHRLLNETTSDLGNQDGLLSNSIAQIITLTEILKKVKVEADTQKIIDDLIRTITTSNEQARSLNFDSRTLLEEIRTKLPARPKSSENT